MGCKSTKPEQFYLETEYKNRNLPILDPKEIENEFEKEAYMIINLLRADPKILIP